LEKFSANVAGIVFPVSQEVGTDILGALRQESVFDPSIPRRRELAGDFDRAVEAGPLTVGLGIVFTDNKDLSIREEFGDELRAEAVVRPADGGQAHCQTRRNIAGTLNGEEWARDRREIVGDVQASTMPAANALGAVREAGIDCGDMASRTAFWKNRVLGVETDTQCPQRRDSHAQFDRDELQPFF
jgi:hypothetical protein